MPARPEPAPGTTIPERLIAAGCEKGNPIMWAYYLEQALLATYTGENKVNIIRDARVAWYNLDIHDGKSEDSLDRQLTSKQAIRELEQAMLDGRCSEDTIRKAKILMTQGYWDAPPQLLPHAANALPVPPKDATAPERRLEKLVQPPKLVDQTAGKVTEIGPKQIKKDTPPAPPKKGDGTLPPHMAAREARKAAVLGTG